MANETNGTNVSSAITSVAVVGAGLVGASWAVVFARAGLRVAVHDADAGQLQRAAQTVERSLTALHDAGLLAEPVSAAYARVSWQASLQGALDGAQYVQESIVESLPEKQKLFAELDSRAAPAVILASSTSAFVTSSFAQQLAGRARCVVAHPVNPPHLVPFVEVSGADFTRADVVEGTLELMRRIGQSPIHVRKEVLGFVMNRLQWTLMAEACRLVSDGVVSADEIDRAMRDGLGRRWAFLGPFEVGDLNAPGGIADYLTRFGPTIEAIAASREGQALRLDNSKTAALQSELRVKWPTAQRAQRLAERDERLLQLAASGLTARIK